MSVLKFKRFTRPELLQRISRPLLIRFFERFETELSQNNLSLPRPELPEPVWAGALAGLLTVPENLPEGLCEALYAIDEMSTPDGQEQLDRALEQAGLSVQFEPDSTREELALQVWLNAPELLARLHNRHRLLRLTAFEYFGTALPAHARPAFQLPDAAALRGITEALDGWFARHHRGRNTTRVELHMFTAPHHPGDPPECWFLVRHGDAFTRASKVEEQRTHTLLFRPQRDDVVVYSHVREELRINARTRGERDLYVRTFGLFLRGAVDFFSVRNTYTLEPLRSEGAGALHIGGLPGIRRVTLRRIRAVEEGTDKVLIREARDLFEEPSGPGGHGAVPRQGRLCSADFDLHLEGCPRPRALQIRIPNVLKLRRHCDLHLVDRLVARFRIRP